MNVVRKLVFSVHFFVKTSINKVFGLSSLLSKKDSWFGH